MDEQNHSENKVSTNIDSIDRSEWGIDVSLYHLRSYFASTEDRKKSEADSRSSQNANLKYYNQLVICGLNKQRKTRLYLIFGAEAFQIQLFTKDIVFYIGPAVSGCSY